MAERFFCADPHFGHKGMVMFTKADKPIRPWGTPVGKGAIEEGRVSEEEIDERVEAMNEAMVENWNRVVGPKDKVELLGDVVINRRYLTILDRLNGKKRLRAGNHDVFHKDYGKYFEEVTAYKEISPKGGKGPHIICSHIPLHHREMDRWDVNVHGHLHTERVMKTVTEVSGYGDTRLEDEYEVIDPRYLCVSMEHIDYTPLSMEEVYQRIEEQQRAVTG